EELARHLEIVRRLLVRAARAVVLAEDARRRLLLAVLLQHLGCAHRLTAAQEQLGGLRESTAPQRDLGGRDGTAALLEHRLGAFEVAGLVVELAGLEHERLELALLLRILPGPRARALLQDYRLERRRGVLPRLTADERLRGL